MGTKSSRPFGFDYSGLKAYSGYFADKERLKQSASGGAATALAEVMIKRSGVVFGVGYTADFKGAEYVCAENMEQLKRLKGSKYISSSKNVFYDGEYRNVYEVVEKKLREGSEVLFIGLGCDVAALEKVLEWNGTDCSRLYTIELVCHGPTSPKVAEQYVTALEKKYKSKLTEFSVRYKKKGWTPPYLHARFENGRLYEAPFYSTDYGYAFQVFQRSFCSECKFKGGNHKADLTVGDYWGLTKEMEGYHPYGVSALLVRTEQGERLIGQLDPAVFEVRPADIVHMLKHNRMYYRRGEKHEKWDEFSRVFEKKGLHRAVMHTAPKRRFLLWKKQFRALAGKLLPGPVKKLIKAIIHKVKK